MNLTIDQGNSITKIGIFDKETLIASYRHVFLDKKTLSDIIKRYLPTNVIISSVITNTNIIQSSLANIEGKLIHFDHKTPLPINILYKTPETLGIDRIAAVVGASDIYPDHPLLIVDAGTAITYDFYADNTFLGGNISPGLKMRFTALHQQTKRLPLIESGDSPFMGTTTQEAIRSGVKNSVIMEFDAYIHAIKEKHSNAKIILTGGDADFFASYTKNRIFVNLNLVLYGLNRIIEYNA
jgi:type III pantothenate kinase